MLITMNKQYLIIEHRSPAHEQRMADEIKALRSRNAELLSRIAHVETLYGAEVQYNNALCDLLRLHSIPFRHVFEHAVRFKNQDD